MKFVQKLLFALTLSCFVTSSLAGVEKANSLNTYFFGHSLVFHVPVAEPKPKGPTNIPHWLAEISRSHGQKLYSDGQFGFLRNHQVPPHPRWEFQAVPSAWTRSFADSRYDAVILTAANFIQDQSADESYANDTVSPLDATLRILDYVRAEAPQAKFYIYENWPDMGWHAPDYPKTEPTKKKLRDYHKYTRGVFHDWWLEYHDLVVRSRPQAKVKMIPVGPILSKFFVETPLREIPIKDLYEDNAPHGKPTVYFLAALIHYMALYQHKPTTTFIFPQVIHPLVKTHYSTLIDIAWEELSAFKDKSGNSRVW